MAALHSVRTASSVHQDSPLQRPEALYVLLKQVRLLYMSKMKQEREHDLPMYN